MHGTREPLGLWLWAANLVATYHPGISAVQFQRQLGICRHETALIRRQSRSAATGSWISASGSPPGLSSM